MTLQVAVKQLLFTFVKNIVNIAQETLELESRTTGHVFTAHRVVAALWPTLRFLCNFSFTSICPPVSCITGQIVNLNTVLRAEHVSGA